MPYNLDKNRYGIRGPDEKRVSQKKFTGIYYFCL